MTITRKQVVQAYIAFCICMNADVFLRVFGGLTPSSNGRDGLVNNPVMFCFTAVLLLSTLALFLLSYKSNLRILLNNPWLAALNGWSLLSVFWSAAPAMVIRGGLPNWAFLLCGVTGSRYLTAEEATDVFRRVYIVFALLSFPFQLFFPIEDPMAPGWTGIYGEKNHLGIGMGVGCIAQLASPRPWTLWRMLQMGLFAVLLVLSQSTTSIGFTLAIATLFLLLRLGKRSRRFVAATVLGSAIIAVALVPNFTERLFRAGGKDTNFTGRDVIWQLSWREWQKRPLLGYGLYSFWELQDDYIQGELGWNPRQAHNGFLEVGLTMGDIGVVLLLGTLVSGARLILRTRRAGHNTAALWLFLCWVAILIDNVTEADFMVPGPLWFTYCVVYFITYAELRRGFQARSAALHALERLPYAQGQALSLAGSGA